MKTFAELEDKADPGWAAVQDWIDDAVRPVKVYPTTRARGEQAVVALQTSTRSALGAVALETAGIVVDDWVRILGAGSEETSTSLLSWNQLGDPKGPRLPGAFIAAFDVVGGVFALDGGAFAGGKGEAYYFAPDALDWEELGFGHSALLQFFFSGALDDFYESLRWPAWREECAALRADQAFSLQPPPWTAEGKDLAQVSRRAISGLEVFELELEIQQQLMTAPKEG